MNGFLMLSHPFTATSPDTLEAGTSAAFVANDFIGMVARRASGSDLVLDLDLGSALAVDTVAILNTTARDSSPSASIAANSSASWGSPPVSVNVSVATGEVANRAGRRHLLHLFTGAQAYRYWRIRLNSPATLPLEVARVALGVRLQPAVNFEFGVQRGARDLGETEFSAAGALLRRRGGRVRTLALSFPLLTESEAETAALPLFEAAGTSEPVLACINPESHPERTRRLYFGPLTGDPSVRWRAWNRFEARLDLESMI